MDRTTAILVDRRRMTESSLVLLWSSADCGLFRTVAKGALRPKSPFAGRLDLFVTCEVVFARSARSDLHLLKEAHLTEPRLGLRARYTRVVAAAYACRLLEMAAEREAPLGGLHDLLRLALDHLSEHDPSRRLVARFERRLCEELGLGGSDPDGAGTLRNHFQRALPMQRVELERLLTQGERAGHPADDFA